MDSDVCISFWKTHFVIRRNEEEEEEKEGKTETKA